MLSNPTPKLSRALPGLAALVVVAFFVGWILAPLPSSAPEAGPSESAQSSSSPYGPAGRAWAGERGTSSPRPPTLSPTARALLASGPIRGIALGLFSRDPAFDYDFLLAEIEATGSPWVSLTFNSYQEHYDSVEVGIPDPRTPSWGRIAHAVRQARGRGLQVLLFPVLLIQDPKDTHWRGTIDPQDRERWFDSYEELILDAARLAEREGVALFSIGSEFNSLQTEGDRWRRIIRRVREVYRGGVTYSLNWDSLDTADFLSELDVVGMTTYYTLTDSDEPTVAAMVERWQALRDDILSWREFHGLPLMFTEVGFASQNGANKHPWNYYASKTVDLKEQADCFEAFTRVWRDEPSLSGVVFYNWFGHGGPQDTGYTPRGKPALEIIRRWFPAPAKSAGGTGPK